MQMTFDQPRRPGLLLAFANRRSRGYMMRSERRTGYGNGGRRKPPRKRRNSFLYIFITLLVSLIIWPLGMVMLWRRKVRMQAGTKLLLSMMTLCVSVFLIVFTLTVPVNNAEFTAFQDRANDVLDRAAARVSVTGDRVYRKGARTWRVMEDFGDAAVNYSARYAADGLDKAVEFSQTAKTRVLALVKHDTGEVAGETSETTPAATQPGEAALTPATAEATSAPEDGEPVDVDVEEPEEDEIPAEGEEDVEPDESEDEGLGEGEDLGEGEADAVEADTPSPDAAPAAAAHEELNLDVPSETPDPATGTALSDGTLMVGGAFVAGEAEIETEPEESESPEPTPGALATQSAEESVPEAEEAGDAETADEEPEDVAEAAPDEPEATEAPEETPEPSPEPTPVPTMTATVKPAGEATVYFYNGGKAYHRKGCQTIGADAPQRTLAEAVEAGKRACGACNPLSTDILNTENVAWVDADNVIHTTDECEDFHGEWTLISLESAVESGYTPCPKCQADLYAASIAAHRPAPAAEATGAEGEDVAADPVVITPEDTPEPAPSDDSAPEPLLTDDESEDGAAADDDGNGEVADSWDSDDEPEGEPEEQEAEIIAQATETPAPTEEAPVSTIALKPAADAIVYHSSNGKFYHRQSVCKGMTGSNAYRFGECVEQGYRQCPNCPAPAPELASIPCMWRDSNGLCHTADTCAAFAGTWTLVPREDAMAQKMPGCTACGANRYLEPHA